MLLTNPLNGEQNNIREVDGKLYWGNIELKETTEEQKKISKTGANYYYENDRSINDNNFFIHLNKEDKTFHIAETFDNNSHTVWLRDNDSITFHNNNNIVFRNERVKRSFAHQNREEANKVIKYVYETLKGQRDFVLFNDPLKDGDSDKVYLEKINDKWFSQSEELTPITEEQKKLSKTNANYSIVNSAGTFLFHLDEKTNKFTLAETIKDNDHTVWLKNKESITYFKSHTIVRSHGQYSENFNHYDGHPDLSDLIKKSYSEFSTYKAGINTENTVNSANAEVLNFPKNEPENTFNPASSQTLKSLNNEKEENLKDTEKLGYLQGLRKELREVGHDKTTMLNFPYDVKNFVAKGVKEKKFLKLGLTAGAVAIIAATPVVGPVTAILTTLMTVAAAAEATIVSSMYTVDYVENKIKEKLGKSNEDVVEPKAKSVSDIKSSISKMRSEAFDNNNPQNQHKIK